MIDELETIKNSISDYFTKDMLKLLFYPLAASAFILYFAFFSFANIGLDSLENTQIKIQQHEVNIENGVVDESHTTEHYTGSGVIDFLLKYTVTSWIVGFLVYTVGLFAIGYLSIFISLIVVGFLTPKILSIINKRHYNLDIKSNFSIVDSLIKLFKTLLVMFILILVLFPFYFIPLVNIVAINLPFYYLFHKMLHFDIGSTITTKEQFILIYHGDKSNMRLRTLFLYTISLIPFVAFFISVFYIIYLGHVYFKKIKIIQAN